MFNNLHGIFFLLISSLHSDLSKFVLLFVLELGG